ncbi:MAG: fimbria/pilus periplasmic chaperone [Gammaproteobacteria bacterium]|nr:fimbria/pilus periplasmic chaperone [Gammaproteobacteria bacterium]
MRQLKFLFASPLVLLVAISSAGTLYTSSAFAAAQLMISPTRVVFDGRTRSAQVQVINRGDESGTYRISFVRKRITVDGEYLDVAEGDEGLFSDTMIRFSPRQVTLPPGRSQVIRLMLRKPRDVQDGEYRSHLLFRTIPKVSTRDITQLKEKKTEGVSVQLTPILGITMPVIVRHGQGSATAGISHVEFHPSQENKPPSVSLRLQREGNQSLYGDIKVIFTPESGDERVVGRLNGMAVYPPNDYRNLTLRLSQLKDMDISNGSLTLLYSEPGKEGGKVLVQLKLRID